MGLAYLPKSESLEFLNGFLNLTHLEITNCNKLIDFRSLQGMESLKKLDLTSVKSMNTLSFLKNSENLVELCIDDCGEIESLKPLLKLKNLERLGLFGNTKVLDGKIIDFIKSSGITGVNIRTYKHYDCNTEEINKLNKEW